MKKLFAIVLATVLVLGIASSALAFTWNQAPTTSDAFGYKVEVVKFTRSTGALGSGNYNADANATAVNGADVYYAIKLTVPDLAADNATRENAKATVKFTAIAGGYSYSGLDISGLSAGIYYYTNPSTAPADNGATAFKTISELGNVSPVYASKCQDTDTAQVYAKVVSERPLDQEFKAGSYYVTAPNSTSVVFADKASTATPTNVVTFTRDASSGKVSSVAVTGSDAQFVAGLYDYLGITGADIAAGKIYMSDNNLRAFAGFAYKTESSATWKANSTPIILDPTVRIPKTGDHASVLGFALMMAAIIAAAAALRKTEA